MDGHGIYGKQASDFVKRQLPSNQYPHNITLANLDLVENCSTFYKSSSIIGTNKLMASRILSGASLRISAINAAFEKTCKDINNVNFDTKLSGTTSCTVLIVGNMVVCSNVGDSRAIMCTVLDIEKRKYQVKQLSQDHKPNVPGESDRILKSNGRIEAYKGN